MPRILVRGHKNPFRVASAEKTLTNNLIGSNTGNLVFSQAVYRLLSTQTAELKTSGLINQNADTINSEYDHVVIPLANAFRTAYLDTLDALSDLIEKLTVPVSVIGVGAQASIDGVYRRGDKVATATRRFVRAVLERSPSLGVRGEFTQQYLRALGFSDEHVDVIGCPSMFMYGPNLTVTKRVEELGPHSPIALNISPYVKAMGPISLYHAEHYPNLVYMAQNHRTLELMLYGTYPYPEDKLEELRQCGVPVTLEHPLIAQDRVRFFLDPQTWFEHLSQYDFSFGTRIHGNISALLAGTPALVLAHDSRTLELADYHQIPHRQIGSLDERADAAELYAESDWESLNKAHGPNWEIFASFLVRHRLTHVYEEGQSAERFDQALAATSFPPPVRTLMGSPPEELYAMKRTLRDLKAAVRTLRKKLQAEQRHPRGLLAAARKLVRRVRGRRRYRASQPPSTGSTTPLT